MNTLQHFVVFFEIPGGPKSVRNRSRKASWRLLAPLGRYLGVSWRLLAALGALLARLGACLGALLAEKGAQETQKAPKLEF